MGNLGAQTIADAVVRVRNLRKSYGGFTAVNGVSFDIERGETFALLGPNGAGKSSTIEILEGYRHRTSGEVSVLGVDPQRGGSAWKARLGIVLQSTGENGNASVREILREFGGYYPQQRDVDEVLEAVGLSEHAGKRVGKLSGGQQRRVDVALGIIGNPELLFLDEPTTGFDPAARRQFWELIRSLKRGGTSILLTTHYLDEAAQLADRAAVIAAGRVIDIGAPDELGGPDARRPLVRWQDSAGWQEERTDSPAALVARLHAEHGGEPAGLQVVRPTLEDIYLELVRSVEPPDATRSATTIESAA